jgi:uncharacterized membrane protein
MIKTLWNSILFAIKISIWSFLMFLFITFITSFTGISTFLGFSYSLYPTYFFYYLFFISLILVGIYFYRNEKVIATNKKVYLTGIIIWFVFGVYYIVIAYRYINYNEDEYIILVNSFIGSRPPRYVIEFGIYSFFSFMSMGWYFVWTRKAIKYLCNKN